MRRLLLSCVVVLLQGCETLRPVPDPLPSVDAVIADAVIAARAPVSEQRLAIGRAQEAFTREQTAINRLRLATLLASLPAPLRDDARATELLEPMTDASAPGAGRLAALLLLQIAERQRLARETERATREAERVARDADRAAKERERLDRERASADKERDKREETLRQQLEALRSIERGILEREDRLRKRQR